MHSVQKELSQLLIKENVSEFKLPLLVGNYDRLLPHPEKFPQFPDGINVADILFYVADGDDSKEFHEAVDEIHEQFKTLNKV